MKSLADIFTSNVFLSNTDYANNQPVPHTVLDNFLPEDVALSMYAESKNIDNTEWKHFTRNGSNMYELNKLELTPVAFNVLQYLHSGHAIRWLEQLTGIQGLIPDPHLVGAGYSKIYTGDVLKVHTDFNWNNTLKLHRACSLIIYLTPDWNPEWGGSLDFYNQSNDKIVTSVACAFNRCLIWNYHKFGFHGCEQPLSCPDKTFRTAFRIFYYTSNSQYNPDDMPHRSQYWIDETGNPYDKPEQR